ncbi:MAG TPA: hypothetical protein VFP66_02060 [Candidatus Limnocylindrales bacterium]|nr:hypothetical protein [Candidatus Limnocylindrales bacterium]
MNPTQDEWMAYQRIDALRREASGSQLLARAPDSGTAEQRHPDVRLAVRRLVERVGGRRRRPGRGVTRHAPGVVVATPSPANPR